MPLRVIRRKDTGHLQITGTIELSDGTSRRVRKRAQTDDARLAKEEANSLEKQILRDAWHGERRGARSFAEAVVSYLKAAPRAEGDKRRINRILVALGKAPLAAVDQDAVDRVRDKVLGPNPSPSTVRRGIITPIRAVMRHASRRGWCDPPSFEIPREPKGRTLFLLPSEADRLIAAAAPHLRPLLTFLLCTGARMSEALDLEWRDVDLNGGRAMFWQTKGGDMRIAALNGRAVVTLAMLPHRAGPVFLWETRPSKRRNGRAKRSSAYYDRNREGGGQIKSGWSGALRRAGLRSELTPHTLRHTWASWHYAVHRDMLALRDEGGWSSVTLVERYAHLLPAGMEDEIRAFWHAGDTKNAADVESA